MKKTICIIAVLLGTAIVVPFTASTINSKFQTEKRKTSAPRQVALAPEIKGSYSAGSTPKAVFYTSVGGSTQNSQTVTPANRISNRYTIEIAALTSQSEAENLLLHLKSKGVNGFYTPVRRGSLVVYRVRAGMFTNSDDASKNLLKISSLAKVHGTVARLH